MLVQPVHGDEDEEQPEGLHQPSLPLPWLQCLWAAPKTHLRGALGESPVPASNDALSPGQQLLGQATLGSPILFLSQGDDTSLGYAVGAGAPSHVHSEPLEQALTHSTHTDAFPFNALSLPLLPQPYLG